MQIIPKLFHYSNSIPQEKEFQKTPIWNANIKFGRKLKNLSGWNFGRLLAQQGANLFEQ
jgi:hypothetical protein